MTPTWIYHERQEAMLCGQHALNNLLQTQAFSPSNLSEIASQLDQMELNFMASGNKDGVASKDYLNRLAEGSGNVDPSGNFSIEVLRSALLSHFNLTLVNTLQENVRHVEITTFEGFICNRSSHWFAIRKINGLFWNLNSTLEKPKQISHFHLAAEIESLRNGGFSVFCVTGNLPPPCTNENELPTRGDTRFWWKEDDLVKGTGSRGYSNSWENLGNGMRLDGKQASSPDVVNLEGMTEEEMIAMAVAASIEQSTEDVISQVKLGPEPDPGQENAVRIQFRFPNGRKVARRFLKTEQVEVLAAFVQEECPGKRVEIKAGFPPKSLSPMYKETLENAKVIGEQIICQFL